MSRQNSCKMPIEPSDLKCHSKLNKELETFVLVHSFYPIIFSKFMICTIIKNLLIQENLKKPHLKLIPQ